MGRSFKIALLATVICVTVGAGYWYFRMFPIQQAENTSLREIFLNKDTFNKIQSDYFMLDLRAMHGGLELPKKVECSKAKYEDIRGKLVTSIAYNSQVERVRSAERAANQFEKKGQMNLASQAQEDAVARFRTAEILKMEIECFEMTQELQDPSY